MELAGIRSSPSILSVAFPAQNPAQLAGKRDAFITSFTPAGGTVLFSTYLGGSGHDKGRDIAVDANHAIYITGITRADDSVIIDYARETQRICVTLDADFHTLLALSNATTPSVIRIRHEGLKGEDKVGFTVACSHRTGHRNRRVSVPQPDGLPVNRSRFSILL